MEPQELLESRWKVGVLALLCLATALGFYLMAPERSAVLAAFFRIGTLLGAFWFAIPVLARKPKFLRWLPWYLMLGLLVVVVFFRYVVFLLPAYIVLAIFTMFAQNKRTKSHETPPPQSTEKR